jgi:hypothetical protein
MSQHHSHINEDPYIMCHITYCAFTANIDHYSTTAVAHLGEHYVSAIHNIFTVIIYFHNILFI